MLLVQRDSALFIFTEIIIQITEIRMISKLGLKSEASRSPVIGKDPKALLFWAQIGYIFQKNGYFLGSFGGY